MRKILLLAGMLMFADSLFAVDLTLSPTSIVWTNQCWLDVSISNIAVAGGVDLKLYLDIDGNGIVNGDDYLVAVFELDDGEQDPFGAETFVDDRDGTANGAIETSISLFGVSYNVMHTIGNYVWEAVEIDNDDNPLGTDAETFEVTQSSSSVWISGRVCDFVSGDPMPGAHVEVEYFFGTAGVAPFVWADENGEFEVYLPDGISTNDVGFVLASAPGMLSMEENPYDGSPVSGYSFGQALEPGENVLPDLYVLPTIRGFGMFRVQGTAYWVGQMDGGGYETNVLSGVTVDAELDDEDLFSWDVTDENGDFSLVLPGDSEGIIYDMWCENPLLNLRGLIGGWGEVEVTGSVSGIEIILRRPDAVVRGNVTDKASGESLSGVEVFFEASSNNYSGTAYTLTNGMYELGLASDGTTYWAECESDSLEPRFYLAPPGTNGIQVASGMVLSNVDFQVERGYLITGHVFDTNGIPLTAGEPVLIQDLGWEHWVNDVDVRFDGFYQLLSPTGNVYVRADDFGDYYISEYHSNQVVCALRDVEPLFVTSNGLSGIDFYLETGARLVGSVGYNDLEPAEWLRVDAMARNEFGEWECIGGVNTEWGGEFAFAVPTGYDVYLRTDFAHGWWGPRTWYSDTCSGDEAIPLSLNEGVTYSGLDIQVYSGCMVNGEVLEQNGMTPLDGAVVTVFDSLSNRYDTVYTDDGGHYGFYVPTNLPLVVYATAEGCEGEFYNNTYNPFSAQPVWQIPAFESFYAPFVLYASGDDTDDDGLPDYLEDSTPDGVYNSLSDLSNPNSPNTDGDESGDLEEYIAGTDPQDPESIFQIVGGDITSEGASLVWSSIAGRQYTLQICTNLVNGTWSNLYSVTAVGLETAYTNSFPDDSAFLRIKVFSP